jgi:hypothetical protein
LVGIRAAHLSTLKFETGVHVDYGETVPRMRDGKSRISATECEFM